MDIITSTNNRYVKLARSLQEKSWRQKRGLYLIEGLHLVEEAWQTGVPLEFVLYTPAFEENPQGGVLVAALQAAGLRVLPVPDSIMQVISATVTPPGVVAVAPLPDCSLAELLHNPAPLLVIAAGLQDPGNLGTIWRTALGAGATGLILTHGSVDPFSPKVVRAAMGASFRLPVVTGVEPAVLATGLAAAGVKLVVADVGATTVLWQADLAGPLALVVGNENHGPGAELLAAATTKVGIPMVGPVESLNAAVAAAILLYEALRQRQGG